ncbi:DASH complex subunit Spc19 [Ceraceosorus bombacis]|uniref:DASH complex subunit SPC19 n=1 Tax=Ceraceosorus bombacis TaxID=401625 RepID=A0A0P1B9J0_9BASI|nr:DASH complex subunit Spc19 [Ceraceosorus bombacis]
MSYPRASFYPQAGHLAPAASVNTVPSASLSSLASCVSSVELSCATLESSVSMLAASTADFDRLSKVLASKRHFDLVSEADIRSARNHLSAEIAPQLRELIPMAEQAVQREERIVKALRTKHAQVTARHAQLAALHAPAQLRKGTSGVASHLIAEVEAKEKRVLALQNKKLELSRKVEQLEREVEKEELEAALHAPMSDL